MSRISPGEVKLIQALTPLTAREIEVLQCLLCGMSNREISGYLNVSTDTVATHLYRIYGKLQVRDAREAIARLLAHQRFDNAGEYKSVLVCCSDSRDTIEIELRP